MDKAKFYELLAPALKFYGKALEPEALDVYFRELGGYAEAAVAEAVRKHMANSRFWPKVPDLRQLIIGTEVVPTVRQSPSENRDYARHVYAAERMFEAAIDGTPEPVFNGTFRAPIRTIVGKGLKAYEERRENSLYPPGSYAHERSARSVGYSTMYLEIRSTLGV